MRSEGYKTKSKQAIIDYLKENVEKTVTVEDIKIYLNKEGNAVNITTIYRFLDKLEKENRLLKYVTDDGKKASYRYVEADSECHEHLHLQCSCCGKIVHLNCEYMDGIIEHISKNHNFDLTCDNSVLYGKCKECQEKEKKLK